MRQVSVGTDDRNGVSMERVISLDEASASDPDTAGRKAATLARLRASGEPVPDGFVVTTAACGELARAGGSGNVAAPGDALRRRLRSALEALGGGPVAVRSSGVAEDLAGASWAGQYETVLGVETLDGLCEAVRVCVASASGERVRAYAGDDGEPPPMAVLVQQQVPAAAAGVAFSANPVTGDRDETLVSAVRGLGDRLVSGQASPDEWVVRDGTAERRAAPEEAITADQARAVAALAEQLEATLDDPQDIEWALAAGDLVLLQARPITALPREPDLDLPTEGTWTKDRAHYPEPMTPLGASVFLPALDAGINAMFSDYGLLMERIENRSVGGEVYGRVTPVGGKAGPPPPWWVLAVLARVVPPLRRRMRTAAEVVREGRLQAVAQRWEDEWRDEFRQATAALRDTDLAGLDDAGLRDHLDGAVDLLGRGQHVHFQLFIPHVVGVHGLAEACDELLGWEPIEAMDLLAGLSEASSGPARALADLAERIQAHPDLTDADDSVAGADLLDRMREQAPELAAAFDEHLERYGHRATNYDPGAPTLAERPQLVASLLADAVAAEARDLADDVADRRRAAERRAAEALADRPRRERERFETALARAREMYGLREDNVFWTDNLPSGLIRRAALEAGRRLAARGQLRRPDDVAYLEIDELRGALDDDGRELTELALRRRAEQAWVAAHPGPAHLGDEPAGMPDVRGLPEAGRRINAAMVWFFEQEFFPQEPDAEDAIAGVPGSPGRYTGPVRVVTGEAGFDRLQPGDVLVAPTTSPDWSVLFGQAGAVVTDGGGTLSHAAVVAREHGIPAVLNTREGTSRLRDGQTVSVDGAAGLVRLGERSS